jgi:hypothetical protein
LDDFYRTWGVVMARKSSIVLAAVLAILLIIGGCTKTEVAPTTPESWTDTLEIARGTVGSIGTIRIGLADTGKENYVDSQGKKQSRLVATLSIFDEADSSTTSMDVHVGQSFEYHGYAFYVEQIQSTFLLPWSPAGASGGGSIRLCIKKL